ncbi:MAG: UDP-2,4-diacetamido-2,4,6-trideoxy-beta-L-altropyranose hydrolase [Gammaproteobacteria bacterium]
MNVVFRTDASTRIGTGHVMRCLTLADALRSNGATCRFVCRTQPGDLSPLIEQRGHAVVRLADRADAPDKPVDDEPLPVHAEFLGVHWRTDAELTANSVAGSRPDWLVVDHYALDARWESMVAPSVGHLLTIDDIADRRHACELLLDQNWYGDATDTRYVGLVPEDCRCLLGPAYALLGPEYTELRESMAQRDGKVRNVLVFIGGSDPQNHTARALQGLSEPDLRSLALTIVLGPNHPDAGAIGRVAAKRPATTIRRNLPTLAPLMAQSDLMVGGGGSTGWQRLCLGLPAVVLGMAENQFATNIALHDAGYIDYLGPADDVSATDIADAIRRAVADPSALIERGRRGQRLVSGAGAAEVSRLMASVV